MQTHEKYQKQDGKTKHIKNQKLSENKHTYAKPNTQRKQQGLLKQNKSKTQNNSRGEKQNQTPESHRAI